MSEQTPTAYVKTINRHGIANVEFFHTASNSLPGDILSQLAQAITDAGTDDSVRVIILRSGGEKAFCAGASFNELKSVADARAGQTFFSGFARVINAARKCPKFILGRIQGKAVGGGVGMAAATDYCFATRHASVKLSELAVGIGPFVVGPAVERKIGLSAMSAMTINATEWFTADWALQKGLYNHVFDTAQDMDAAIDALAQKLVNSNPEAMKMLKGVFWEGTEHWDTLLEKRAAMSGKLVLSNFTKNAIAAFGV